MQRSADLLSAASLIASVTCEGSGSAAASFSRLSHFPIMDASSTSLARAKQGVSSSSAEVIGHSISGSGGGGSSSSSSSR